MTRRPENIKSQIDNIGKIEGVVVAMRALAAAHTQEARRHLDAIREHQAAVAQAMAHAITCFGATNLQRLQTAQAEGPHLRIIVGAAQGFSGLYNERIIAAAKATTEGPKPQYILVGQRCISELADHGIVPVWSANMVAHTAEVPALASQVVDAVFEQLATKQVEHVSIIHAEPGTSEQTLTDRRLIPFDFQRSTPEPSGLRVMTTLPPKDLIEKLVEEYVFAEICEALMVGFAAENDARMAAMTRARSNVRDIRQDLFQEFSHARQEQMTTEIIELSEAAR
tara:strand:+ start:5742 stop:6587 length:846 start_codon:yes stop_codon:yes gene_type:complete